MIAPIQTRYNGYHFRSRLEARWAVFFDTLGIRYEYEPQGFDIDGVYYLPDFWISEREYWIEVKGRELTPGSPDQKKVTSLATAIHKPVYVTVGGPWLPYEGYKEELDDFGDGRVVKYVLPELRNYHRPHRPGGTVASHHWWYECPLCRKFSLTCFGSPPCDACGATMDDMLRAFGLRTDDESFTLDIAEENRRLPVPISQIGDTPEKIKEAYRTARSARFEHGETPSVSIGNSNGKI